MCVRACVCVSVCTIDDEDVCTDGDYDVPDAKRKKVEGMVRHGRCTSYHNTIETARTLRQPCCIDEVENKCFGPGGLLQLLDIT